MWQEITELAYGELRLKPWEFDEYTFDDFILTINAKNKAEVNEWQHTRALAYVMAQPYMKKKMSVEQFWPLPGDKVTSRSAVKGKRFSQMTKEEQIERLALIQQEIANQALINSN
jgi:hypothetical protein